MHFIGVIYLEEIAHFTCHCPGRRGNRRDQI